MSTPRSLFLASRAHCLRRDRDRLCRGSIKDRDFFDDNDWRDWQAHWYTTGLQGLEAQLAGDPATGTFCHGDTLSMADICVTAIMVIKRAFAIEVPDIPIIDAIVARCEAIEAFAKADPWRQPGAPSRPEN